METIRILLPAFLLPLLVAAIVPVPIAFRDGNRLGWLGPPWAVLAVLALLTTGIGDRLALAAGAAIASLAAASLPGFDRKVAVAAGAFATWLLIWFVPQGGADSPVNFVVAGCTLAFAVGALSAILLVAVRRYLMM
jgi:hypothetical protein